jgi:hypothetical protein
LEPSGSQNREEREGVMQALFCHKHSSKLFIGAIS